MSDNYWSEHPSNPINDNVDTEWCESCQSNEIEDNDLCHECLHANFSECCGAKMIDDCTLCPECKENI